MYLAAVVIFRVFFAVLYVIKWQCRYSNSTKYMIQEYNLESEFRKLKKNKDQQESSDDKEDIEFLEEKAKRHKRTLKKQAKKRLRQSDGNLKISKREKLDETKRLILEADMKSNIDSDDDRMDFIDPIDEEQTDRLVNAFRKKGRPLMASEVDKISHGNLDNMRDSVLSNVMVAQDFQYLQHSQHEGMSNKGRPVSKRILLRSLAESQRSRNSLTSNGIVIQAPVYAEVPPDNNSGKLTKHRHVDSSIIDQYVPDNVKSSLAEKVVEKTEDIMNRSQEVKATHSMHKRKGAQVDGDELSFGASLHQSSSNNGQGLSNSSKGTNSSHL